MISLLAELSRALRCCRQEAVFCENLTFTQFFILDVVEKERKIKLSDLHNVLSVEKSTTTRLVTPLVKQGLICKEKALEDARAVNLTLTNQGREVHRRVLDCVSDFFLDIEMKIPDEKRADVYEAVEIFLGAMRNACAKGACNP